MTQNKSYSRPLRHLRAHLLPPCLRSPQLPPPATCGSENASGRSCFGASSAAVPSAQNALPPNTYVVIASLLSGLCSNVILSERSSRTILSRIAWARARARRQQLLHASSPVAFPQVLGMAPPCGQLPAALQRVDFQQGLQAPRSSTSMRSPTRSGAQPWLWEGRRGGALPRVLHLGPGGAAARSWAEL